MGGEAFEVGWLKDIACLDSFFRDQRMRRVRFSAKSWPRNEQGMFLDTALEHASRTSIYILDRVGDDEHILTLIASPTKRSRGTFQLDPTALRFIPPGPRVPP